MTRDDIVHIALEAGLPYMERAEAFERFAARIIAAERNRTWSQEHWTDYERGLVAAEREACVQIIEQYRIPVGNSAAGELACEWTYAALKEIRDDIRARGSDPIDL